MTPIQRVPTNIDKSRSPILVPFAILAVMSLLAGCAALFALRHGGIATAGGTGDAVPIVSDVGSSSFAAKGPFGVGETTLHLASNGAAVHVWYPASPSSYHGTPATYDVKNLLPESIKKLFKSVAGVPYPSGGITGVAMADGRFPMVVFSHGFAGFSTQSTFLTAHLASWGFVVAAPEHIDRDLTSVLNRYLSGQGLNEGQSYDVTDLSNTISLMATENQISSSTFYRHLDMNRVGAVGHSAGGSAVEKLAVVDPSVKVFVGLAGASYGAFGQTATGAGSTVPSKPGLLMYGTEDKVVTPGGMTSAYNALKPPKRLIGLQGSGHLVFSDICRLAVSRGGLVALAEAAGLPIPAGLDTLGTDGCTAGDLPVGDAWPAINQSVTAELRWALGFDPTQAGLDGLVSAFPGVISQNTTAVTVPVPAS